jgi:hypothetical protein
MQLSAGVDMAALAAKPLDEQQVGTGQVGSHGRATQMFGRLAIELVGGVVWGQQCVGASLDAQCPLGAGGRGHLFQLPTRTAGRFG